MLGKCKHVVEGSDGVRGGMSMSFEQHRLGVAVVGLGIGEQHARAYQALRHCQLRWLYDVELGKA